MKPEGDFVSQIVQLTDEGGSDESSSTEENQEPTYSSEAEQDVCEDGQDNESDESSTEGNQEPAYSSEAEQDAFEDSQDDESDAGSSIGEERVAYGLVLHPAGKSGKFFRVGIWTSIRKGQNGRAVLDFFRSLPSTTVVVI